MSVVALNDKSISVATLLAQIADCPDTDAVVAIIRSEGCWRVCWTSAIDLGGLSLAAVKLLNDVQVEMHRDDAQLGPGLTGPEKPAA